MKKLKISFIAIVMACTSANAQQWTSTGSDIINSNTGNVRLGSLNPITVNKWGGLGFNAAVNYSDNKWRSISAGHSATLDFNAGTGALTYYTSNSNSAGAIPTLTTKFNILKDGNLGIGSWASSNYKMYLYNTQAITTARFEVNLQPGAVTGQEDGIEFGKNKDMAISFIPGLPNTWFHIHHNRSHQLQISSGVTPGSTPIVTFDYSGSVGIGTTCIPNIPSTTTPYKLAVQGRIIAEGIRIRLRTTPSNNTQGNCGWGDFVFDKSYELLPLTELESYIATNRHLPGIPAAKEVEAEGFDLEEMVRLQMIKIEELTLHVIQLKKENDEIKKYIGDVSNK